MIYDKIRRGARDLTLGVLSQWSTPKPGIHILNGHFLSLNNSASNNLFRNQLLKLKKCGIKFIELPEAVERITNDQVPPKECLVAFTFDDGFEECYTKIRPVLNEFKIKAGFFINPNFVDGDKVYIENFKKNIVLTNKSPMQWNQIINLHEEGHIIGAHTMDHVRLEKQTVLDIKYQLGECKKIIERKLNTACEYFAFPYGKLSNINEQGVEIANCLFKYTFSQSDYRNYFSFEGKVINRRHFECNWPYKHVLYFLKRKNSGIK